MSHKILQFLHVGFILSVVAVPMTLGPVLRTEAADGSELAVALQAQVNKEGQVTVMVKPLMLSATADTWRFEVQFDTHVTPLNQDLLQAALLTDAKGHDERPSAWEGDPAGGHHRKGVLVFKPIVPTPASVTLKIDQVGSVPERLFTWTLTNP